MWTLIIACKSKASTDPTYIIFHDQPDRETAEAKLHWVETNIVDSRVWTITSTIQRTRRLTR